MNALSRILTGLAARKDAALDLDAREKRLIADRGLDPSEALKSSLRYREALQTTNDSARREELREDIERGEDLQALVGNPSLYTVALIVVWCVEFAGALLLLRSLGFPAAHRPLPALALTLALVGLTTLTTRAVRPDPSGLSLAPEGTATSRFRLSRFLVPLIYGVLVGAIALVRVFGSDADDGPTFLAWAEAALMVAITVGPAFAAAHLEEKRRPAAELARRLGVLRTRLRREERRHASATKFLHSVDTKAAAFADDGARRRAQYAIEHARTRAAALRDGDEGDINNPNPNA